MLVSDPAPAEYDVVHVYVTDYGVHSAVVLPLPPESEHPYVEYAFGDFNYAARSRNAPWDALGALFLSFGSGFGRTYIDADPVSGAPMFERIPKRVQRLAAPRAKVDALLTDLNRRFVAGRGPAVVNPRTKVTWVHDREHYSWANNCNHLTARSLKEMGFEVSGLPTVSKFTWKVGDPIDPALVTAKPRTTPAAPESQPPLADRSARIE
jgi:hypothetical protein